MTLYLAWRLRRNYEKVDGHSPPKYKDGQTGATTVPSSREKEEVQVTYLLGGD